MVKYTMTVLLGAMFCSGLSAQDVKVTIDRMQPATTSRLQIGVTHTQGYWEYGNQTAVERAGNLLINGISCQNQHLMGWGAGNPEPQPGVYNWEDLDHRVALMRSIGTPMFITFCTAPGWMKKSDDWSMEEDVKDDFFSDFASLCGRVAARYPDVGYFQVWNEMKGFWNSALNNWDYVRYTKLYNRVFDSVKAVRPDAKIGGPYLVIQGDGGVELGKNGTDTYVPIGSRDWEVINYWWKNKHGADFFCFDYGLIDYHDPLAYTHAQKMALTKNFGRILAQLTDAMDIPIVISEFYGGLDGSDQKFIAANHASCYYHALLNKASLALIWNPQEGEIDNYLFTSTQNAGGGLPSKHYAVVDAINRYFSRGTALYHTTSTSEAIEVLSSASKTMLINKADTVVTVDIQGERHTLDGYEVRVVETPAATGIRSGQVQAPTESSIVYRSTKRILQITPSSSGEIELQMFNVLGQKVDAYRIYGFGHSVNTLEIPGRSRVLPSGSYFIRITGLEKTHIVRFWLTR